MVDNYKIFIFAGTAIVSLSVCSTLGNYFVLKSNLDTNVEERVAQIRNEFHQINFGGSIAKLQAAKGLVKAEEIENGQNFDKMSTEDLVKLISYMNSTLSKDIKNLRNISQVLNQRLESSQQKMKLFEEFVGHSSLTALRGRSGSSDKIQAVANPIKGLEKNNIKVLTKAEKQTKNRQVTSSDEKHVYFSVSLTNTLKDISPNHVIIFDLVYSNEGFGYNARTGTFTVPVSGTYFFMFFVEVINVKGKSAHINLFVDGKVKASVGAEAWHDKQDMTSANAVVIHLTKGQKVWLQTASLLNKKHDIYNKRTTFTGVLLFS